MAEKTQVQVTSKLQDVLTELAQMCPDKKKYEEITTVMFQLHMGNDFGAGMGQMIDLFEDSWSEGRKMKRSRLGLHIVK